MVVDHKALRRKVRAMQKDGADSLFVIADFDRTLTTALGHSCHMMLSNCKALSEAYRSKTEALYKEYYPLEVSHTLTREEKIPLMKEWYHKNHTLLLSEGLTHQHLREAVEAGNTELRPGSEQLVQLLDRRNVPLLVFSAGIGNIIDIFLTKRLGGRIPGNTHIVSNQ